MTKKTDKPNSDTLTELFCSKPPYADADLDTIIAEQRDYLAEQAELGPNFRDPTMTAKLSAIADAQPPAEETEL